VIGTFSSAYVNAGNLGLPIAAYVLGDASLVAPMLLYPAAGAAAGRAGGAGRDGPTDPVGEPAVRPGTPVACSSPSATH
jgi:hypothetical protein